MSKHDILHSSRKFLYAIYQNYVNRACENLGVSKESDDKMEESEYPSEFKTFTQEERKQYIEDSGMTDEEFLSQFSEYKQY